MFAGMRVLFTTWAWPSHLYPMVPLAWALRAAGNDVAVAGPPGLAEAARCAGLPFAAVGSDIDAAACFREILTTPATPRPDRRGPPRVLGVFRRIAEATVGELTGFAGEWRPDLLVAESTTWAGFACAAALDLPVARFLYGLDLLAPLAEHVRAELGPLADAVGGHGADPYAAPVIDPCPPSFRLPGPPARHAMRYVPFNGSGPLRRLSGTDRPRVALTWGYTMAKLGDDYFFAREALAALGRANDMEIVVAAEPGQRGLLGPLPAGTALAESAPLHAVLGSCDAVVAHGGAGSLLTALSYGLPQVLVPQLPDHVRHAARLAEIGAGISCPRPDATPGRLRELVTEVLHRSDYRNAAERLATEIAEAPSPVEVARELGGNAAQNQRRQTVRTQHAC